jgi:hypothetical protein
MTDDELRVNLESLRAACHELFEASQRHDAQIAQLTVIARDALDSIKRLERIATAHQDRLDDHERRIDDLES